MLDMQLSFGGVKNTVGSALLPVVTDAFKEITSWIAENRAVVSEWAGEFAVKVKAAIPAVADLARGVTSIFLATTKTVSALIAASGGVEGVGKKLLWLMGIKSSVKLFGVTKDLWDLGKATKDFIANSSSIQAAFSAFKAGIASGGGVLKKRGYICPRTVAYSKNGGHIWRFSTKKGFFLHTGNTSCSKGRNCIRRIGHQGSSGSTVGQSYYMGCGRRSVSCICAVEKLGPISDHYKAGYWCCC